MDGVEVFHAGTSRGADRKLVTAGGRVLTVTGMGDTFAEARARAYEAAACDQLRRGAASLRHRPAGRGVGETAGRLNLGRGTL